MIPSENRMEISVKGATSVLVGVKGLTSSCILNGCCYVVLQLVPQLMLAVSIDSTYSEQLIIN